MWTTARYPTQMHPNRAWKSDSAQSQSVQITARYPTQMHPDRAWKSADNKPRRFRSRGRDLGSRFTFLIPSLKMRCHLAGFVYRNCERSGFCPETATNWSQKPCQMGGLALHEQHTGFQGTYDDICSYMGKRIVPHLSWLLTDVYIYMLQF